MAKSQEVLTPLVRVTLHAETPCCKSEVRLAALVDVPRQTYTRRCERCRTRWHITRESMKANKSLRIDRLEWEAAP